MSARAAIGDYVVTSKLGSGSFAVVYKGYHKTTKVPVAIKAMSLGKLNSKLLANLETEISIMRQINHPNVVKLYEIKKTEKHIYLILEYCAGGDLQQYMRRQEQKAVAAAAGSSSVASTSAANSSSSTSSIVGVIPTVKRERLSEDVAHHFLKELAKGMMCLWSHNLIHRDLKPQNLLLVEDSPTSALKIADFGFARHLATTSLAETLCGSPLYMAPEILKFQKYDAKADLWSVGTILYEMVVGKPPYGGSNHVQLLANIERNDLRFPSNVELSVPCKNLLLGLLQRKPANRMGFDDFFNHPFVGLRELSQSAMTMMSRSASRSTTAASIREEDEEMDEEHSRSNGESATERDVVAQPALTKERAASDSLDSPSPSNSALRQSRSDNIEVMQTAFGSTSSAGSAALRRSSRLGRSRRATSSGAILVNQQTTSPKLSPQMSPHMLPSPSPRINPFKLMAESPPGVAAMQSSGLLRASGGFLQASQRLTRPTTAFTTVPNGLVGSRQTKGGVSNLESSDEYVLVDSGTEKAAVSPSKAVPQGHYETQDRAMAVHQSSLQLHQRTSSAISDTHLNQKPRGVASFSHEYGQQLVDIVMLRTQAISPIAEQLWKLSSASVTIDEQRDSATGSGTNLASMFSMGSSMSSSSDGQVTVGVSSSSTAFGDDDGNSSLVEKKQYVFAAEALALYVKCLRIIQHGISYLRQDPVLSKRLASSPSTPPVPWSEASRKLSMAYLTEQFNCFLDRAEQCKKRMSGFVASADAARVEEFHRAVVSQEELLYTHAIRLGKQGAVKEVLGQTRLAYEHYLQSMLLLETLLMDTTSPSIGAASGNVGVLAVDDQKCVNAFLKALDERLKNVKLVLDEESRDALETQQQLPFSHASVSSPLASGGPP